jgi:hypothetical protein
MSFLWSISSSNHRFIEGYVFYSFDGVFRFDLHLYQMGLLRLLVLSLLRLAYAMN